MLLSRYKSAARSAIVITVTAAAALLTVVGSAHAQAEYLTSFDLTSPNYEDRNSSGIRQYGFLEFGGQTLTSSGEVTYSFGEGSGAALGANSDTIRFSGTGEASVLGFGFTDLKAGVKVTLEDAYLDLRDIENAPVVGDGMKAPYLWSASAAAGWKLTSRFNALSSVNGPQFVRWIFIADGVENSTNGGSRLGTANLSFRYGTNFPYFFGTSSLQPQAWATDSMPFQFGVGIETSATFVANWNYSLETEGVAVYGDSEDGESSELIGYRANSPLLAATVDYHSSVVLDEIQVFDGNGNRFYDFTVDDGNGNVYYNGTADAPASVAAPEPGTLGLIALSLLPVAGLYRRAARAKRS